MVTLKKVLLCALLLVVIPVNVAFATGGAQPDSIVDKTVKAYETKFNSYTNIIHNAAMGLFASLFLCQFAWSVAQLFLQESFTFSAVITTVLRQVITGAFFWWLLFDRSILKTIVDSFEGLSGLKIELAALANISIRNCKIIINSTSLAAGYIEGLYIGLVGFVTAVIVAFVLATATGYLAIVMLENYIVGSLGLILLGFGGSEYTRNYALSYIKTLVHIGFKLFLVSVILIIGIGIFNEIGQDMVDAMGNGVNADNKSLLQSCTNMITTAFFFIVIIKVVPQISDTLISGVSMGIGAGGAAIRSGVAGAAAAGGLVVGAAAGLAVGAAGTGINAVGAAANAYHSSKAGGRGGFRSAGAAAASAFGSSVLGIRDTATNVFEGVKNNLGLGRRQGQSWNRMSQEMRETYSNFSLRAKDDQSSMSPSSSKGSTTPQSSNADVASKGSATNAMVGKDAEAFKGSAEASYNATSSEELMKKFKTWE